MHTVGKAHRRKEPVEEHMLVLNSTVQRPLTPGVKHSTRDGIVMQTLESSTNEKTGMNSDKDLDAVG